MKKLLCTAISFLLAISLQAANSIETVSQVSTTVQLTTDVDYVITDTTPFAEGGRVDIVNTEHAVLIFQNIRPSKVIASYLGNVYINGQKAVNGSNCQVKMYAQGTIIMPYGANFKPLTVYSEKNFGGTSVNSFGLENTGGYMNTLSEAKLNNQIRSFKLKRGYMVTFSTRAEGRGYSRCFIADKEDLEISSLPQVLDQHISSYRVFQWLDAQKKGLASDGRAEANAALASSWCYDWGTGNASLLPDVEWVPNHIYEDWPSSASCGSVTGSCHMKTNNEPGNSADDHPQDVATVLANWENLMRTGMRLCSESSHDGSMSHLKAFIDSIDARGWRCDILDLHCYWPAGSFNNLTWYSDYYGNGRPIWISEWVWGASWNNNGAFAVSNRNDYQGNWANTYNGTKPILDVINANSRVERYAYWNSEANCSKIYLDGVLSTLGQYYASMTPGLGYNKDNEYIPRNPRQYNPSNLSATYDKASHQVTLSWRELNGEYNRSIEIQSCKPGNNQWQTEMNVTPLEAGGDYEVTLSGRDGIRYRVRLLDLNNKERLTNEATAVNEHLEYGDEVSLGEETLFLGGNMLLNGSFDLGLLDWTNGAGEALSAPYFQALSEGGIDGGNYLQCYGGATSDKNAVDALRKVITLEENGSYYVQAAGCNNDPSTQRISTTTNEKLELNVRLTLPAITEWAKQGGAFTITSDKLLLIQMRQLAGKAQFDEMMVCKLFTTRDEALANALELEKARVELFKSFNTAYPRLNTELDALSSSLDAVALENALQKALRTIATLNSLASMQADVTMAIANRFPGYESLTAAQEMLDEATSADTYLAACEAYIAAHSACFEHQTDNASILNPTFSGSANWTISGTYKGGDQRTATQAGLTCWNAWWNISAIGNADKNLGISQTLSGLPSGYYALNCKATTQHLCETDQHAFIQNGEQKTVSGSLPLGLLDLPGFANADKWKRLSTSYIYVGEGEEITVGFESSKNGATDKSWMQYGNPSSTGDNREGWWCATDFSFSFIPLFKRMADEAGWGTICLPYAVKLPSEASGLTVYEVAGINVCTNEICIQPVDEIKAGYPYLFHCDANAEALFFEYGDAVRSCQTNVNGLRGTFTTSAKYPIGALVLTNGVWQCVETRYSITPYSAYVRDPEQLTRLDSWSGPTLPIEGYNVGIEAVHPDELNAENGNAPTYNLAGQRVSTDVRGVLITRGKKVTK